MRGHLRSVQAGDLAESGTDPVRVVLAEDHAWLRRSLRLLLEREGDLDVVGEAGDLDTAMLQVRVHRPDVLVLDLRLGDGSSTERTQRLREQAPETEIVVVTLEANRSFATRVLRAGATGCVLTDSADLELCDAVRRAARGLQYMSPRLKAS